MDINQQGHRRPRGRGQKLEPQQPQLFDDTSGAVPPPMYGQPPEQQYGYDMQGNYSQPNVGGQGQQFAGQQFLNDPMASMAVQYGHNIAEQGKDYVHKNLEKYVSTSKLKYYFAVDTSYVGKKLGLLVFPYMHKDWSIRYSQDEPIAPRYEVNAPDMYIPVMAIVTYILLAGVVLGTKDSFTPEQLGSTASTAIISLIIEIGVLLISMYILRVSTDIKYYDVIAYCGYKYVGMILALAAFLVFQSRGYYMVLLWTSLSTAFFLVRSLKMAIIPHSDTDDYSQSHGNKRRLYMLLVIALSQPVIMWLLTVRML